MSSTARVASVEGGDRRSHPTPRGRARALNAPRAALVETNAAGVPIVINRQQVALIREEWRVVDRWWTDEPVYRRYFDCVLAGGMGVVVFHDAVGGGWLEQKA
ncbi:MAG: hypothetical protein ACYDHO_06970 [Gaiellaceae bacterium]